MCATPGRPTAAAWARPSSTWKRPARSIARWNSPKVSNSCSLSVDGLPVDAVRRPSADGAGRERGPCPWLPRLPSRTWNCSSSPNRQLPRVRPVGPGGARSARQSWVICRSSAPYGPSPRPAALQATIAGGGRISRHRLLPAMRRPATLPRSGSGSSQKARPPFPAPPAARPMRSRWIIGPSKPSPGCRGWRASRGSWSPWDWPRLLIRRGLLGNWFARWPYVFGVGLGLAWWLWLSPSAVGLLIVLAVLLRRFLPWEGSPGRPQCVFITLRRDACGGRHWEIACYFAGRGRCERGAIGSSSLVWAACCLHEVPPSGGDDRDGPTPWTKSVCRTRAASVRAFMVCMTLARRTSIERTLRPNSSAISRFDLPLSRSSSTSRSGGVSCFRRRRIDCTWAISFRWTASQRKASIDGGPQPLLAARFQQKIEAPRFIASTAVSTSASAAMPITGQWCSYCPERGQPIQIDLRMGHVQQDAACIVGRGVLLEVFRRVAQCASRSQVA